jgi:hypothetical protein
MFERLLAALIILALLVLVMFIALPYPTGGDRTSTPPAEQPPIVDPNTPQQEAAKPQPPAAGENKIANNDAAPPPVETPPAGAQDTPVPNPPGKPSGDNSGKAPVQRTPATSEKGGGGAQPVRKLIKPYQDKLPLSAEAEQPSKPALAAKGDKSAVEKPKPGKPKSDKLKIEKPKTETASRIPARQPQKRHLIKDDRDRDDGIGDYIRRTEYSPPDWRRTHYYECTNGQCDCRCERPYWARRGAPCWD